MCQIDTPAGERAGALGQRERPHHPGAKLTRGELRATLSRRRSHVKVDDRVEGVRKAMKRAGVHAFIFADVDPHQSEYVPDHFRTRTWISGFGGSAGVVVITQKSAGLWTDSRYYLEAAEALAGTTITLFRDGLPGVPGYAEWTASDLSPGEVLAVDENVTSVALYRRLDAACHDNGLTLHTGIDPMGNLWKDRPAVPDDPIFLHEERFCGRGRKDKLEELRSSMAGKRVGVTLVTALDDLAWLFNIRGTDVDYNPVATGYAVITADKALLFLDPRKISDTVGRALAADGIELRRYDEIAAYLRGLEAGTVLAYSPEKTSYGLYKAIPAAVRTVEGVSQVARMKACKNETEQKLLRSTMVKDGVALENFFHWLEEGEGQEEPTELSAARKLRELRSRGEHFVGESFAAIAGFGAHGAIVHYSADEESDVPIRPDGLLLLDSGAQYLDGTTDITRVAAIGRPSAGAVRDYTVVLKAHIALATIEFPEGTTGPQLDSVAREVMWRHGANYGHGTGHGVGFFLNVHEGPQRFGSQADPVALEPGMYTSNEPGLYREGLHGIRIENLVLVQEGKETDFGRFYRLETITLCHLEPALIDVSLLSDEELRWVNDYQSTVRERLTPHLDEPVARWLEVKTAALVR